MTKTIFLDDNNAFKEMAFLFKYGNKKRNGKKKLLSAEFFQRYKHSHKMAIYRAERRL